MDQPVSTPNKYVHPPHKDLQTLKAISRLAPSSNLPHTRLSVCRQISLGAPVCAPKGNADPGHWSTFPRAGRGRSASRSRRRAANQESCSVSRSRWTLAAVDPEASRSLPVARLPSMPRLAAFTQLSLALIFLARSLVMAVVPPLSLPLSHRFWFIIRRNPCLVQDGARRKPP